MVLMATCRIVYMYFPLLCFCNDMACGSIADLYQMTLHLPPGSPQELGSTVSFECLLWNSTESVAEVCLAWQITSHVDMIFLLLGRLCHPYLPRAQRELDGNPENKLVLYTDNTGRLRGPE